MRRTAALAIALLAGRTSLAATQAVPDSAKPTRPRTMYEDMQLFSQVLNQIRLNHPDSIDTHELMMAAVEGMVHAADPHSFVVLYTPLTGEKQRLMEEGKLFHVPIAFDFIEDAPVVVSVTPGTAASRQEIFVGDELIAIDGAPVTAQSSEELDLWLAGAKKTSVRLTLVRRRVDGTMQALERDVVREAADEQSAVAVATLLDATTGYVRITTFEAEHVADDLHRELGHLESRGMQRLILDLRNNGGGRIDQAAQVAGEFLPSGSLVYTREGRKRESTDTSRVKRSFWKSERRFPVVLLINQGTASASELVAGALQDHDRALIVGRPSFGKALMMYNFPLMDGSVIYLVVGHVRTPCGRIIQRQYHAMSRHEYYRLAGAVRDTVGRPWCKTDAGRIVYGGGGIYPDILFKPRPPAPLWAQMVSEHELILKWAGGYVSAVGGRLPSLDSLAADPRMPPEAVQQFRTFAAADSVEVPAGPDADALLNRLLVRGVATAKWGEAGFLRITAVFDPEVTQAAASFDRAQALLGPAH